MELPSGTFVVSCEEQHRCRGGRPGPGEVEVNRQRLLTLAVAANAVLTIVALIRIYTVSNLIQSNLSELSGNLQVLGRDIATLNEQVRRTTSSVSDLTDDGLKAVRTTVTHLNENLTGLDSAVGNLQGFTKDQVDGHGTLSQSIASLADTLHTTGEAVVAASTADGGPVPAAMNAYRHDLLEAGEWAARQNSDVDGGLVRTALNRYVSALDASGRSAAEAIKQYRADVDGAAQNIVRAGQPGGAVADAQSAYASALATAGTKASDQVRDRLDRFFQDNQSFFSKDLLKKIDARCQCTCAASPPPPGEVVTKATPAAPKP
jgi:uncharacterized phage infection (PIP) family protein YhgE